MKKITILFFLILIVSCKEAQNQTENFGEITVDKNIVHDTSITTLSKYPELKLFNSEKVESSTRTTYIVQNAIYFDPNKKIVRFNDYKAKAFYKGDTLEVWLNNYNGYFGNGVIVRIFKNHFKVYDINPNALRNELKFIKSKPLSQKLILNTDSFNKNDSIYGFINYTCKIDSLVEKNFRGYFKTQIQ